jgi:ribosomal protein L17
MLKRNLLTSLLLYENVRTTKKRAAVIAPQVDKMINYAKTHSPHVAIRYINKTVTDTNASKKIMEVFIKRYAKRSSGLTRTKAAGFRVGDGAEIVDISLLDGEVVEAPAAPVAKKAPKKESTPKKS